MPDYRQEKQPESYALYAACMAIGIVFMVSGWSHLQNPMHFYTDLIQYQILDYTSGSVAKRFLILLEIVCGVALVSGFARWYAAWISAGMLLLFCSNIRFNARS